MKNTDSSVIVFPNPLYEYHVLLLSSYNQDMYSIRNILSDMTLHDAVEYMTRLHFSHDDIHNSMGFVYSR